MGEKGSLSLIQVPWRASPLLWGSKAPKCGTHTNGTILTGGAHARLLHPSTRGTLHPGLVRRSCRNTRLHQLKKSQPGNSQGASLSPRITHRKLHELSPGKGVAQSTGTNLLYQRLPGMLPQTHLPGHTLLLQSTPKTSLPQEQPLTFSPGHGPVSQASAGPFPPLQSPHHCLQ